MLGRFRAKDKLREESPCLDDKPSPFTLFRVTNRAATQGRPYKNHRHLSLFADLDHAPERSAVAADNVVLRIAVVEPAFVATLSIPN